MGTLSAFNTVPIQARQACDICHKSRKFFCYTCHVPLPATRGVIPRLQLPVRIDIVKHPGEVEGKSTAVHARLVAPEQVTIHIYPDIPDYTQVARSMPTAYTEVPIRTVFRRRRCSCFRARGANILTSTSSTWTLHLHLARLHLPSPTTK